MSWDLYVGDEWAGNYTHNTNPIIRAASIAPRVAEYPGVAAEVLFRATYTLDEGSAATAAASVAAAPANWGGI